MKKYTPINCSIYDELVLNIQRKQSIRIVLDTDEIIEGRLKDIFTENKEEFVLTEKGEKIRLDHIKSFT